MQPNYDYYHTEKLEKILSDDRLKSKYGKKYSKYLRIGFADGTVYRASRAFLELLLKGYGNVSFGEAYGKCDIPGKTKEDK